MNKCREQVFTSNGYSTYQSLAKNMMKSKMGISTLEVTLVASS